MRFEWQQVLPHSSLFQGVPQEKLRSVWECLNPRVSTYEKNEIIAVAGERLTGVGVMLSGEAIIIRENAAGNRMVMAIIGPGEMFGEIAAFSGNEVWPATVVAQEACTAMFVPPEKITGTCARACSAHKMLVLNTLRIISLKALMLSRKLEYLSIRTLRGKISAFLLEQSRKAGSLTFMMPLNRDELADFLNVSRPALSREMGRMRDEGIIEFHRSSMRIKDREALAGFVE